ncbi:hypothetical protein COHA_002743 [Chlorella ohadii]|uniref:Apple domain-containing protein n=1 Tax=Chlorella ohadii TaxID=2649997 RepID=A0AAD5H7R5_9CHLO|nr:hypothetical protein COHA_002743 [Chlorella ohadii]
MWFGRAPLCSGSCPPGWQQVTAPLRHGRAWRSEWSKWSNGVVDVLSVVDSENQPYYYTAFGLDCNGVGGKVLCALGGRPESAGCRYTWRGTAPDCRDACEAGETLIAKDWYGDGKRCGSGTYNKMLCERCQQEILNLNDCTTPTWFGTAPFCAGECNVGDRVMARAQSSSNVPSDQDPGGFGKTCASISGWKVRCQLCSVRGLLGSGPSKGRPTCTAPKAGHVWPGSPVASFPAVKTYAACCQECRDAAECRLFHVGPTGCFLFAEASGAAKRVVAGGGRAGGGAWQAGSKVV